MLTAYWSSGHWSRLKKPPDALKDSGKQRPRNGHLGYREGRIAGMPYHLGPSWSPQVRPRPVLESRVLELWSPRQRRCTPRQGRHRPASRSSKHDDRDGCSCGQQIDRFLPQNQREGGSAMNEKQRKKAQNESEACQSGKRSPASAVSLIGPLAYGCRPRRTSPASFPRPWKPRA